jgi:hypothetical protein
MPWKESSDGRACRGVCFAEKADAGRAGVAVNSRVGRHGRTTSVSGSDQDESLGPAPYL